MKDPVRYDEAIIEFNGYSAGLAPNKDGDWVKWEDYARLKAEVERLTVEADWKTPARKIKALEAEVERLTEIIRREVDGGVDLREEAQRTVEENHKLRAEADRLRKALINSDRLLLVDGDFEAFEVGTYNRLLKHLERLRGAGDALYKNQLEGMEIVGWKVKDCPLMMAWLAAKEGKPSV